MSYPASRLLRVEGPGDGDERRRREDQGSHAQHRPDPPRPDSVGIRQDQDHPALHHPQGRYVPLRGGTGTSCPVMSAY